MIYELPRAQPLLTGPGRAAVTTLSSNSISGWVGRPGAYLLRIRYTRYARVTQGAACLSPTPGDMTRIDVLRAGPISVHEIESPTSLLVRLLDGDTPACSAAPAR
jgi:hypothetical protein